MKKSDSLVDNWFKNKSGQIVLTQYPNIPLWIWLCSTIGARIIMHGRTHQLFESIAFAAICIWAYLEITLGVNYFRRSLGIVVLVLTIINQIR